MIDIETIRRALDDHHPGLLSTAQRREAAVALVLRHHRNRLEMLFIERARHEDDPWSGQMAFPGGRRDPGDIHVRAAAERETLEELGLSLSTAEALGRIDDLQGRSRGKALDLVVSCFAYLLSGSVSISPNHEVNDFLWVPLTTLFDPDNRVVHHSPTDQERRYPGIRVSQAEHIVWGLTYRFVQSFLAIVGRPITP